MIEEDYVTFEQANLLKEKGFPQRYRSDNDIRSWYYKGGKNYPIDANDIPLATRPSLSLVQKWLREEKNIEVLEFIQLIPNENSYNLGDKKWVYKVENKLYKRYERALSQGIDKALKLI